MITNLLLVLASLAPGRCNASPSDFPPPKVSTLCPGGFREECAEQCCSVYSRAMAAATNKKCISEKMAWTRYEASVKIGLNIYQTCSGRPEDCLANLNSWLDVSTSKLAKDLENAEAQFASDSAAALAQYVRCMSNCCN